MRMSSTIARCLVISSSVGLAGVQAAEYPTKTIRLIGPSAAGGAADISGRMIAGELGKQMGQQVVVDNRGGANGIIGYDLIAKAAPDGYTFGMATFPFITNPIVIKKLPYDTAADFQPVVLTGFGTFLLTVNPQLPIQSVRDLIGHARNSPGKLSYAGGGAGGGPTLSMELFKFMTGTQIAQISYKGLQQGITETISGQVHIVCDAANSILPHVRAGRLRALGVTTPKRLPSMPEVPTIAEAGVPGYEMTASSGYILPAHPPRDVLMRLNAEINKALRSATVSARYAEVGLTVLGGTPEQFEAHLRQETAKWTKVITAAGIKPQ